jgi:peptidoglycan hydrolase-like protein with peptidoglycan-binding domain
MKHLATVLAITLCAPLSTLAGGGFTSLSPEKAYPNDAAPLTSGGEFEGLFRQVQERLQALGFDAGPANGAFSAKTQAALVQFQLSRMLPASGALDETTLSALGVERAPSATAPSG